MNFSKYMLLCCLGAAALTPDTACAHSKKHHHSHSKPHTKKKCPQKCASPAFTKRGLHIYKDFVENEIINIQVAPGWGTVAIADGQVFENYQGYRDIDFYNNGANPIPMTSDTILRIASQSKFLTAVGFLTLADKGYAAMEDNLSDYIPEFADTKVIEPCTPYTFNKLGNNPLATTIGSPDVVVTDLDHGMATGDFVIITQDLPFQVNGIPEVFLESVFPITVIDPDHYRIINLLSAPAAVTGNAGKDLLNVAPLAAPGSYTLAANPLATVFGSSTITITDPGHSYSVGDVVALQLSAAFNGIPAAELNNVHTITATTLNTYDITVTTLANNTSAGGGTLIRVFPLCFGAKQTTYLNATYYYKEIPLVAPLKVHHLLTHTSGHCYTGIGDGAAGFDPNVIGAYRGVASRVGPGNTPIPEAIPNPALPLSSSSLQTWAATYAKIPLLYQPGAEWSYGPQLGILGAVIENADPQGRGLEQFMKEELFDKIGMHDTGFFVQGGPGFPEWDDKVPRFAVLYDNSAAPFIPFIPVDSVVPAAHAPLAAAFGFTQTYNYAGPRMLPFGDGGMYSTMRDYVKFLKIILNNGKTKHGEVILSPAMIAALSRNQINDKDTSAILRLFINSQEVKQMKWGLGVGLTQGINSTTLGASTKQLTWSGAFRTSYIADLSNQAIFQVGTNMVDLSTANVLYRASSLSQSVLRNALDKVNTFDEQLYTPGTASPYNFNDYVPTAVGQ